MLPIIPSWWISAIAFVGGILCIFSIRKVHNMIRSSVVKMVQLGLVLLAPALIVFGGVYFYFTTFVVEADARQAMVRFLLFYLFIALDVWQIILLRYGKEL